MLCPQCELHGHHHSKLALATASVHPGKIKQAHSPSLQKWDTWIFTLNKILTTTSQCSHSLCEVCISCASLLLAQLTYFNRLLNNLHLSRLPLNSKCFEILHKQTSGCFPADLSFFYWKSECWTQKPEHHRVSSKQCVTHSHQSGSLEGASIVGREPTGLDTSSVQLTFTESPVQEGRFHIQVSPNGTVLSRTLPAGIYDVQGQRQGLIKTSSYSLSLWSTIILISLLTTTVRCLAELLFSPCLLEVCH